MHVIDETTGEYKILDEPFYDHQKKDTRVYMSRSQGIDILSSDFEFEKDFPSALNLLDVPFRMHGLDVQFDPVKLHTSSVVLKVDSLPSKISNAIGFQFYYPQISSPHRFQTKVKICLERRKESQDYAKVRSNPDIMDNQVKRGRCQECKCSLIYEDICSLGAKTLLTVS